MLKETDIELESLTELQGLRQRKAGQNELSYSPLSKLSVAFQMSCFFKQAAVAGAC